MVVDLWAVRHGQSTANVAFEEAARYRREDAGIPGKDADVPLSVFGRTQAAALGRWLASLPGDSRPEVAYESPYWRAHQTLKIMMEESRLAPGVPVEVRVDERLRDRETGILELLTPAAIARRYPAEADRRQRIGEVFYRPPGGESMLDVAHRTRSFLNDLDAEPARGVLVVGHDATVLMMRAVNDGLDETALVELMARVVVANASVSHWHRDDGRWARRSFSTVAHLPE
ncbi:MAG: 2,3-bisphosphoglycerate-dependent phosphoglycerate mutase [Actinomycetota bacterium]|nr:2,3-bisphosphoglycerate-dependent phosphoglycerate mutase [Actinomycetota bacterium]